MVLHIRQVFISLILTAIMTVLITLLIQKQGWQMWFVIPFGYIPTYIYLGICLEYSKKSNVTIRYKLCNRAKLGSKEKVIIMALSLDQINELQMEEMRHALGLARSKEPYRNSFYTETNNNSWNDLVEKGFATKHKGWEDDMAYFKVTGEAVQLICPNFKGIDIKKILR